jgi:peptidyl-prolyl cis-trans isomerase B (cyclophilin B)
LADTADIAKPTSESKKPSSPAAVLSDLDDGLSMGQKLFFLGVIVGICALFLRSRGGTVTENLKVKSMA